MDRRQKYAVNPSKFDRGMIEFYPDQRARSQVVGDNECGLIDDAMACGRRETQCVPVIRA